MNDLIEWLRAQLDADEQLAQATGAVSPWSDPAEPHWAYYINSDCRAHIVRHSPASALADIAAKRAIIDWFESYLPALDVAVMILATAYADRPGYQEAWRP